MPERVTGSLGRANIVPDSGRNAGSVNNDASAEWGILQSRKNKSLVAHRSLDTDKTSQVCIVIHLTCFDSENVLGQGRSQSFDVII